MGREEEIRSALREWVNKGGPKPTLIATTLSVDDSSFTCVLVDDQGVQTPDVRLRPVLDDNESITLFPTVGSWALAVRIEDDDQWMLIAAGSYDKYRLVIGSVSYEVTNSGHVIKKGSDDLWSAMSLFIQAVENIIVLQGRNVDVVKLEQAKTMFKNILNGT